MIKIDYKIERNESDEIVTYIPKAFPKQFENVIYIKGPNSSGKSTLLNLIALGFFGNKLLNSEIDPSLKTKIENLLDIEHQKLTFDICVDNPKMGITLITKKSDPDSTDFIVKKITSSGEEKLISADAFFRDFRLIYDIPQNPLERLPQLIDEIRISQNQIGQRLAGFRESLRTLIIDIQNSRDPKTLTTFNIEYVQIRKVKEELENEVESLQSSKDKLNEFYLSKYYLEAEKEAKEVKKQLDEINATIQKLQKNNQKVARSLTSNEKKIEDGRLRCHQIHSYIVIKLLSNIEKSEQDSYSQFKGYNIDKEIYNPEVYKTMRNLITHFIDYLTESIEREQQASKKDIDSIEVYKLFLATFSNKKYSEIPLPGINQTIASFIQVISMELQKYEGLESRLHNLEDCVASLQDLGKCINDNIILVREYQKAEKEGPGITRDDAIAIRNMREALNSRLTNLQTKITEFRSQFIKANLDPHNSPARLYALELDDEIEPYDKLGEVEISSELHNYESIILKKNEQLTKYKQSLAYKKAQIDVMEGKKQHILHNKLKNLEDYFQKVQRLEQRFTSQFSDFIIHVSDLKKSPSKQNKLNADEMQYVNLLGKLLASKIDTIKYIDGEYKVEDVDILERKIITVNKKIIRFSDLGTGQGQAAFLQAKLAMSEKKKIIALFDEVAMIDEKSLEPVKNKLRELYFEGKLFLAIIVQKNDKPSVESLI